MAGIGPAKYVEPATLEGVVGGPVDRQLRKIGFSHSHGDDFDRWNRTLRRQGACRGHAQIADQLIVEYDERVLRFVTEDDPADGESISILALDKRFRDRSEFDLAMIQYVHRRDHAPALSHPDSCYADTAKGRNLASPGREFTRIFFQGEFKFQICKL